MYQCLRIPTYSVSQALYQSVLTEDDATWREPMNEYALKVGREPVNEHALKVGREPVNK